MRSRGAFTHVLLPAGTPTVRRRFERWDFAPIVDEACYLSLRDLWGGCEDSGRVRGVFWGAYQQSRGFWIETVAAIAANGIGLDGVPWTQVS